MWAWYASFTMNHAPFNELHEMRIGCMASQLIVVSRTMVSRDSSTLPTCQVLKHRIEVLLPHILWCLGSRSTQMALDDRRGIIWLYGGRALDLAVLLSSCPPSKIFSSNHPHSCLILFVPCHFGVPRILITQVISSACRLFLDLA
jgi:hypothetical protein